MYNRSLTFFKPSNKTNTPAWWLPDDLIKKILSDLSFTDAVQFSMSCNSVKKVLTTCDWVLFKPVLPLYMPYNMSISPIQMFHTLDTKSFCSAHTLIKQVNANDMLLARKSLNEAYLEYHEIYKKFRRITLCKMIIESPITQVLFALYALALVGACLEFYSWGCNNNRLSSYAPNNWFGLEDLIVSFAFFMPIVLLGIILPYLVGSYLAGEDYPKDDYEYSKFVSIPMGIAKTHYQHVLKTRCESYRVSCG